jgi:5'(3')-deoxyribonucleotidase
MRSLKILVDLDGICADMTKKLLSIYNAEWDDTLKYEDITSYNFGGIVKPEAKDAVHEIYRRPGFYKDLEPIPGAIETIARWKEEGHRPLFCSSPPSSTGAAEKYDWVLEKFGFAGFSRKDVILANQKDWVKADALVDDCPKNARLYRQAWPGAFITTIGQPYNLVSSDRDSLSYDFISGLYPDTTHAWAGLQGAMAAFARR